ncbi:MAG TPA: AAA family ATPase [Solirubrobacteraceae bacterium]|nr:AAA family ATPase [Solirubrobacteraceae bacterium]
MLERDGELARLQRVIEESGRGVGRLVLIEGPAGIGKTRLLDEACQTGQAAGMEVLRARGVALESTFAFGVVRQLFEAVLAGIPLRERRKLLGGAAGIGGALLGFAPDEAARPVADATFASLHGLYWLCFNLAARRPLLIAVDDAHWADAASLRFVSFLAARLDGLPVAVLVALRPGKRNGSDGLLESIQAEPGAELLTPSELSERATEQFIGELFDSGAEPDFCRACFEATGGNPFYLRALVDGLHADGIRPESENAQRIAAQVPDTVVRALMLRLSRLPFGAAQLARALAVLGPDTELRDAAALAGLEVGAARNTADVLADAGILARGRPLRFMHPIIAAAIYADLGAGERSQMHLESARILTAGEAAMDRCASHLLAVEPSGDGWIVKVLREAAAEAVARGAPESAVAYLNRARREHIEGDRGVRVLRELGLAEFLAGHQTGLEHLREALELTADIRERALIARDLGNAYTVADRFADTVTVIKQAISDLGGADHSLGQELEAQMLGAAALYLPTRPAHRELLDRLDPERLGDSPPERQLLANIALWRCSEGMPASVAQAIAERALAGGKLLDELTSDSQLFYAATHTLMYSEAFERARYWLDRALADARARGSLFAFAIASASRAECDYCLGELAEVQADGHAALQAGGTDRWVLAPMAVCAQVKALIEQGRIRDAQTALAGWNVPLGLDQPGMTNWLSLARGRLALATGSWGAARDSFLAVGEWMTAWGERNPGLVDWRTGAALALAQLGDTQRARELCDDAISLGRDLGQARTLGVGLWCAAAMAGGADAVELLGEAVPALERASARLDQARALIDLGAALRRGNHRRDARQPLREGVELAQRCGATALAQRGHAELIASGARPRRTALSGADSLTPSEGRVARLAADGLTTPEIAQQLFVTVNTVESHLRRTYLKLGIHARDELVTALAGRAESAQDASGAEPTAVPS